MANASPNVPTGIQSEVGELLAEFQKAGWSITASLFDARFFGNWYVDLDRDGLRLSLVKDRSQYMITGRSTEDIQPIKDAGLWRAFDDCDEFCRRLTAWVTRSGRNS
jgi:hypothetical protein